ncbi:MAG TPA: DEAD/DEAH box helicase [Conexibacter sp.]|nr:DEAD/DEAH box helicase [Conexibacter sp.]
MAATDEIVEPWEALLARGRADDRLVHESIVPPRAGRAVPIPGELHHEVRDALGRVGIAALHTHQEQALYAAIDGPTIVTTGTASGKSLCFNLPTLQMLHVDPRARALYLYPTKALAQDQVRALAALRLPRLRPAIYDGDTPQTERRAIRRAANVVLTNPDMLHVGILPNHAAWGDFLANLAVVVVDEAHVYRGVFGSHVANVLRRLRRIAAAYGTEPRFLLASATVANPLELAQRLTGLDEITLVDEDGAPSAQRTIAMWNPPLLDETLGSRASALSEAADLFADLVAAGSRTICFIKSRKAVEVILRSATARLRQMDHPELAEAIAPYRAGYTAFQRRELEQKLMSGQLRGVVATDALELGIDIGELDAAICVTFPGTVASLRQMWGRAGRRGRGLAVYVAGEDALDQFFCRHRDEFLERPVEAAILDHESEQIHAAHLVCAAHEGPLSGADAEVLGPRWREHAERLVSAGVLIERRGKFQLRSPEEYPAARVPLRSSSTDAFTLIDVASGEVVGTMEAARAFNTVHDGAVYLHMGRAFEVEQLDLHERRALLRPFDGDWFTQPRRETMTAIERLIERRETMGVRLSFGTVVVTDLVVGYQRKSLVDHETIDFHALELPETAFSTQALWYELEDAVLGPDAFSERLLGALHAAEHAQIAVLPLLAMCDRWDIGGLSTNAHPQTGRPTIFIYDGHPGGVGITRQGFLRFEQLVGDAHRLVSECRCKHGCPSCIQSPKCGNLNEPLSKGGASALMRRLLSDL